MSSLREEFKKNPWGIIWVITQITFIYSLSAGMILAVILLGK